MKKNLYYTHITGFGDDTVFLMYSFRTNKVTAFNEKESYIIMHGKNMCENSVLTGQYKRLSRKQAFDLLTPKKVEADKITYYKHSDMFNKEVLFWVSSYNHNTKESYFYMKNNNTKPEYGGTPYSNICEWIKEYPGWIEIDENEANHLIETVWKGSPVIKFTAIYVESSMIGSHRHIITSKKELETNRGETVEQCLKRNKIAEPIYIFEGHPKEL